MTATIHKIPPPCPEHLAPSFNAAVGGPLSGDARCDIDKLLADIRSAWDWAAANQVAVLSVNADRNGAYLVIAPSQKLHRLFGDECAQWRQHTQDGLRTENWIGCIGHIRVFWWEVTCVH